MKFKTNRLSFVKVLHIFLSVFIVSFIFAEAKATNFDVETNVTKWMDSNEYQNYFDEALKRGFYPVVVEGKLVDGYKVIYRANFIPFPKDKSFHFDSRHGNSSEDFSKRHIKCIKSGFSLIHHQYVVDDGGRIYHQATWVKIQ
jgi:hypothetical protein